MAWLPLAAAADDSVGSIPFPCKLLNPLPSPVPCVGAEDQCNVAAATSSPGLYHARSREGLQEGGTGAPPSCTGGLRPLRHGRGERGGGVNGT